MNFYLCRFYRGELESIRKIHRVSSLTKAITAVKDLHQPKKFKRPWLRIRLGVMGKSPRESYMTEDVLMRYTVGRHWDEQDLLLIVRDPSVVSAVASAELYYEYAKSVLDGKPLEGK